MVEQEVLIRQATTDDFSSLGGLMNDLGYKTSTEEMKKRLTIICDHEDYRTFVATVDNNIVGMAGAIQNFFYEQNGKYVRVVALVTSSACRQQGVGSKLMQSVENWAREVGASAVLLNCGNREERKAAHHFYKNRGYMIKSSGYVKNIMVPGK